jgi:hypothetical protein
MARHQQPTPYFVFISHSSTDSWTARQIEKAIAQVGAATFLSEIDVTGGDDIGVQMREAMRRADECLVLYTPEAAQSKNVWIEIGGAWMAGKRVVLVLNRIAVSDITNDPRFPPYLKSLDLAELNSDFDLKYLSQLAVRTNGGVLGTV